MKPVLFVGDEECVYQLGIILLYRIKGRMVKEKNPLKYESQAEYQMRFMGSEFYRM